MLSQPPYEITASVENQPSHEEGTADAEILPGTGVVWYPDANGDDRVRQADVGEPTARVAIATGGGKTGPAYGAVDPDLHPLDIAYAVGEHTYTLEYLPHDKARLRLSSNATDPTAPDATVGWDTDGTVTDTLAGGGLPETSVARGLEVIARSGTDDLLLVEFL